MSHPFDDRHSARAPTGQGRGPAAAATAASLDGSRRSAGYTSPSKEVDVAELCARVPLTAVLARYGVLDTLRRSGHRLVGPCPIHNGSNRRQFIVDPRASTFFCFGDCDCGDGTIGFVAMMESISRAEAAQRLAQWFTIPLGNSRRSTMSGRKPSHKVLSDTNRKDPNNDDRTILTRIGVAWPTKDGKGLSLVLDALPLSGRLLVLEWDDEERQADR